MVLYMECNARKHLLSPLLTSHQEAEMHLQAHHLLNPREKRSLVSPGRPWVLWTSRTSHFEAALEVIKNSKPSFDVKICCNARSSKLLLVLDHSPSEMRLGLVQWPPAKKSSRALVRDPEAAVRPPLSKSPPLRMTLDAAMPWSTR